MTLQHLAAESVALSSRRLRYEILLLLAVGAEALWISLFSRLIAGESGAGALGWPPLFAGGLVILFWSRWRLARGGRGRDGRRPLLESLVVGALVTSTLMVLVARAESGWVAGPVDWLAAVTQLVNLFGAPIPRTVALVSGLLLWGRVFRVASTTSGTRTVLGRFYLHLALILMVGFLLRGMGRPVGLGPVALFFVITLLAFALARAAEFALEAGGDLPFSRRWLGTLAATVAVPLVLALLLIPLVQGAARLVLALTLLPLLRVAGALVGLLARLDPLLTAIFSRVPAPESAAVPAAAPTATPTPLLEPEMLAAAPFPPWVAAVAGALLVAGVLVVVMRMIEPGAFWDMVVPGVPGGGGRFARATTRLRRPPAGPGNARRQAQYRVDSVRALYRSLLLFGDRHGVPRPAEETPYEYLAPLNQRYPALAEDFRRLTEAYVRLRYGELDVGAAELDALRRAWERIAQTERQEITSHV